MKTAQEVIKYVAISLAVLLMCGILMGIISAGFVVGYIFGDSEPNTSVEVGSLEEIEVDDVVEQELSSLHIDLKAADVVIESGDEFKIEANEGLVELRRGEKALYIQEKDTHFWDHWSDHRQLKIVIPRDWESLETLRLNNRAGRARVQGVKVRNLELDSGAGKVEVWDITVSERAKVSSGAGFFQVRASEMRNLDLDMGVGKVELEAKLSGNNDIDAGVGKLDLRLLGDKDDYRIKVEKGLGSITLNGGKLADDDVRGDGETTVDIDGGVGAIDITTE